MVVSDFRILAFVKRRGKGRDHKSGYGQKESEIPPGHLRRDVEQSFTCLSLESRRRGQSQRRCNGNLSMSMEFGQWMR